MLNKSMTISAAIAALRKEVADRQSAIAILEAVTAPTVSDPGSAPNAYPRGRRGGKRGGSVGPAAVEIIRAAGRPLHGLSEIVPALEARGIKIRRAALSQAVMRTGQVVRVAPGTFGLKDGAGESGASAGTKELEVDA